MCLSICINTAICFLFIWKSNNDKISKFTNKITHGHNLKKTIYEGIIKLKPNKFVLEIYDDKFGFEYTKNIFTV